MRNLRREPEEKETSGLFYLAGKTKGWASSQKGPRWLQQRQ